MEWIKNVGNGSLQDTTRNNKSAHKGQTPTCAEIVHEEQCGLLDPGALPLAALHHHSGGVEVLLLLSKHDLYIVLVLQKTPSDHESMRPETPHLDGPQEGAVCVRSRLEAGHDGQVKVEEKWGELPDPGSGPLYASHLTRDRYLRDQFI